MSYQVKRSATEVPLLFLMVQSVDHISGLTGASPTVTLSKAGAAFGSPAGAVSEVGNGWYEVAANATDTNTLGPLVLHATASSGDPVDLLFDVVAYDPQDGVRLGLTSLPATACTGNASLITSGVGTDQLSVASGKTLLQATQTGVTIPTVTSVGILTTYTGNTPQTGDSFARLGAPSGASIDADILSRLASADYTSPPSASAIVAAMASGSVASVSGAVGSVTGGVSLASTGLDLVLVESGVNLAQAVAIIGAAVAGACTVSGSTVAYAALNASGTARISATAAGGVRSAITLSLPSV